MSVNVTELGLDIAAAPGRVRVGYKSVSLLDITSDNYVVAARPHRTPRLQATLLAPTPDADIPEDAVGLIWQTLKRAFRPNSVSRTRLEAWFHESSPELRTPEPSHRRVLLESSGHGININAINDDFRQLSLRAAAWAARSSLLLTHTEQASTGDAFAIVLELATVEGFVDAHYRALLQRIEEAPSTGRVPSITVGTEVRTPIEASRELRDALLAEGWPTSEAVAVRLGSKAEKPAVYVSQLRARNKLLGAYSVAAKSFVHPTFQFTGGQLNPRVADLVNALYAIPGFSKAPDGTDPDKRGWHKVLWLYQPRGRLSERNLAQADADPAEFADNVDRFMALDDTPRAPADVFATAPDAVMRLAMEEALEATPPGVSVPPAEHPDA